jgi:hypothetical protein
MEADTIQFLGLQLACQLTSKKNLKITYLKS